LAAGATIGGVVTAMAENSVKLHKRSNCPSNQKRTPAGEIPREFVPSGACKEAVSDQV
jgi:hypothetical protein